MKKSKSCADLAYRHGHAEIGRIFEPHPTKEQKTDYKTWLMRKESIFRILDSDPRELEFIFDQEMVQTIVASFVSRLEILEIGDHRAFICSFEEWIGNLQELPPLSCARIMAYQRGDHRQNFYLSPTALAKVVDGGMGYLDGLSQDIRPWEEVQPILRWLDQYFYKFCIAIGDRGGDVNERLRRVAASILKVRRLYPVESGELVQKVLGCLRGVDSPTIQSAEQEDERVYGREVRPN